MPRDGAITFRDIAGKLAVLRVERDKCGRRGRYPLPLLDVPAIHRERTPNNPLGWPRQCAQKRPLPRVTPLGRRKPSHYWVRANEHSLTYDPL
jgi:hypothetical protein